ncbi:MAG: 4'-phosphopantetheinyl transferase superfamily protein [Lachnospiraceae bacterium]|nr:4'-phosphopantetheinyl transferase superfamily protein [Lachnospiraceae bacterium]
MRTECINGLKIYIVDTDSAEWSLGDGVSGSWSLGDGVDSSVVISQISPARRNIFEKMKNESAKRLSLAATLALREALSEYGIDEAEQEYEYNEYGRPSLKSHPEISFSLSHAGTIALAGILRNSSGRDIIADEGRSCENYPKNLSIGIDIEEIKRANERIAGRFFSEGEKKMLAEASDYKREFTKIWTAHEAFGKALGTGLSLPKASYEAVREGSKLYIRYKADGVNCRDYEIFQSDCCEGYIISVCVV